MIKIKITKEISTTTITQTILKHQQIRGISLIKRCLWDDSEFFPWEGRYAPRQLFLGVHSGDQHLFYKRLGEPFHYPHAATSALSLFSLQSGRARTGLRGFINHIALSLVQTQVIKRISSV